MRQKRAKSYKKQVNVYLHTFKFREPFQAIVDDQIVLVCTKASFDLVKGLRRTLQAEVKPMITQCCMQSLYKTNNQDSIDLAKSFERRRCNHPPSDPLSPQKCVESVTNVKGENKHRYVVATQDINLRKTLRSIPAVPMVYMNRSVMVMEPISDITTKASKKYEEDKLTKGLNDHKFAGIKHSSYTDGEYLESQSKKRNGASGPNPLSVKKRKISVEQPAAPQPTKKRRRKHTNRGKKEKNLERHTEGND